MDQSAGGGKVTAVLKTSLGEITLELDAERAPITVANFVEYAEAGHYDGTVFHRVIPNFMIQGGGMSADMRQKTTRKSIKNEAANGLKNERGTVAMARTAVVDSATSQFFINLKENSFLNYRGPSSDAFGYCVFGKVTAGQEVVDAVARVQTGTRAGHQDVPLQPVTIQSVTVSRS
jgi:cyclophilin family peptidyl-prolyl cis-trans isomerase